MATAAVSPSSSSTVADSAEAPPPMEAVVRGFIIRCKDADVSVTKSQAELMVTHSVYFRNVFRHGTTECIMSKSSENRRILTKPDWTVKVARSIIELLCRGETTKEAGSSLCQSFYQAVDQIQLPVAFVHRFCESPQDTQNTISTLSMANEIGWMDCRIDVMQWRLLVSQGILFWFASDDNMRRNRCPISVYVGDEPVILEALALEQTPLEEAKKLTFKVFSKHDKVETVSKIFNVLSGSYLSSKKQQHENNSTLTVKFKARNKVKDIVSDTRLEKDDILYSEENGAAFVQFSGTFQALYDQVCLFKEDIVESVGLCVKNSDHETLTLLMESCHYCVDSQGTIGVDVEECAIYLKKTPRDCKRVLEHVLGKYNLNVVFGCANQQSTVF